MQNIKAKLENFLDKENKFIVKEGLEEEYKLKCRKMVTTIVGKVYEALINCEQYLLPNEFFEKKLPAYSICPGEELIEELFREYTPEMFRIFESDLLDSIQAIKLQSNNCFVGKMLEYVHTEIIRNYKSQKERITNCYIFNNLREYDSLIQLYISLIKKEISSQNENSISYSIYLKNLKEIVDELIKDLKTSMNNGCGELYEKRMRYAYYYVKEEILGNF